MHLVFSMLKQAGLESLTFSILPVYRFWVCVCGDSQLGNSLGFEGHIAPVVIAELHFCGMKAA